MKTSHAAEARSLHNLPYHAISPAGGIARMDAALADD